MAAVTTVGDLIALLDCYDPATPVMLAHQPAWPLAETIGAVVGPDDQACPDHFVGAETLRCQTCGQGVSPDDDEPGDGTVWLVAGGHAWDRSPYAPAWVFEAVEPS
jgi:hypothetical protein